MIHARSIVKRYNGFTALDGVSFDFEENGIFGIIGHNGAGKTTLLKILAGLLAPTSGSYVIDGIDVIEHPNALKEKLGYLPEESRLYETMTVDAYLSFFGEIYGLDTATIAQRSSTLLSQLSLEAGGKRIGELSKGMRRKVAIARSLIHEPSLLIYDEPTSGLDPMTSRYISEFLRDLRTRQNKTVILSAHNLYQVEEICDRVMILRRGKEVAFGTMDELRETFGTLTYEIHFTMDDTRCLAGVLEYREEGGVFVAVVHDVDALNEVTACIAEGNGRVKKIESKYPSLEEMLVKIGK
ncbi:MAG: ABC transporter ATP-binding protein [Methanomicrobiales archaeon]|nr:ABC transporter ATP-binding protein [Methanomicrobiales archaeon]